MSHQEREDPGWHNLTSLERKCAHARARMCNNVTSVAGNTQVQSRALPAHCVMYYVMCAARVGCRPPPSRWTPYGSVWGWPWPQARMSSPRTPSDSAASIPDPDSTSVHSHHREVRSGESCTDLVSPGGTTQVERRMDGSVLAAQLLWCVVDVHGRPEIRAFFCLASPRRAQSPSPPPLPCPNLEKK